MPSGLQITFNTLAASRNEASNAALLTALSTQDAEVYDQALKAAISRRSKAGHLKILAAWHILSPKQRQYLQEGRGRMSGALRDAVLSVDEQLFGNACEVAEHFCEFDLIPTLVTLAENQKHVHAEAATKLVLQLVERLSGLLYGKRDPNDRRDPSAMSRFVLESLERSVERFRDHNRAELVEAFVILGGPTSGKLREILEDIYHPCYTTVIGTLTQSQSAGVIKYLLSSLNTEHTSLNLLNVISKRDDPLFVNYLLEFGAQDLKTKPTKNLGRIRSFAWLKPGKRDYHSFDDQAQQNCIKLVAKTGVKPDEFLDLLESILKRGEPNARGAACDALAEIPGDRGNHLVLDVIDDQDAKVQAAATRQIRDRHVPGAMAILLRKIDSPHSEVRDATREALSEFSFANFLAGFEGLHDDARRTTGGLVKKVDQQTVPSILSEMEEKSHKRRLRAIEIAEVMELVPDVSEGLLSLLEDEDHLIRAAVADALQFCPTGEVQEALRRATHDRSGAVQNSAKSSLEVFDRVGLQQTVAVSEDRS